MTIERRKYLTTFYSFGFMSRLSYRRRTERSELIFMIKWHQFVIDLLRIIFLLSIIDLFFCLVWFDFERFFNNLNKCTVTTNCQLEPSSIWLVFFLRCEVPILRLSASLLSFFLSRSTHQKLSFCVAMISRTESQKILVETRLKLMKGNHRTTEMINEKIFFKYFDKSYWRPLSSELDHVDFSLSFKLYHLIEMNVIESTIC
jgi:hypothetical protein